MHLDQNSVLIAMNLTNLMANSVLNVEWYSHMTPIVRQSKREDEKVKEIESIKERMVQIEKLLVTIQPLLQHVKPEILGELQVVGRNMD